MLALGTGVRTIQNTLYKNRTKFNVYFKKKKMEKGRYFKNTKINLASKMKSYTATEKAGDGTANFS